MPEHFKTVDEATRAFTEKLENLACGPRYYRLLKRSGRVERCHMMQWAESMERKEHVLFQHYLGDFFISTVFLGLDHSFDGKVPILFETMVFDNRNLRPEQETIRERRSESVYQDRCSTYQEIWGMHWEGVAAAITEQSKWMLPL